MAKKVTIQGSNLLQNLNDDWGGVNNSQGSVTPYSGQGASTPVPAGAEWGMNRGEVERFIKSSINAQQSRDGYYVCDNSASTAAKTVVASGYQLATGGNVRIKMTNANTANNVTLNINSTGAKALYYNGSQASATNTWKAGEVLEVYYDGTQYQCAGGGDAQFASGENVKETSITDNINTGSNNALLTKGAMLDVLYGSEAVQTVIEPTAVVMSGDNRLQINYIGLIKNDDVVAFNCANGYMTAAFTTNNAGTSVDIQLTDYTTSFSTVYNSGDNKYLRLLVKKSDNSNFTKEDALSNVTYSLTREVVRAVVGVISNINNLYDRTGYFACLTAANIADKVVSAEGFILSLGGNIRIKMTYANTANGVTLNINGTGAKNLYYNGVQASSSNTWEAGDVLVVYYDGTQYQCESGGVGKFATGEMVKDVGITDHLGYNDNLPTSKAVYGLIEPTTIDLTRLTSQVCSLGGSKKWYRNGSGGSQRHIALPVVAGEKIMLSATHSTDLENFNGWYAWCTSSYSPPYSTNQAIPMVASENDRIPLPANQDPVLVIAPEDAAYLILTTVDGGGYAVSWTAKTPAKMDFKTGEKINEVGITDELVLDGDDLITTGGVTEKLNSLGLYMNPVDLSLFEPQACSLGTTKWYLANGQKHKAIPVVAGQTLKLSATISGIVSGTSWYAFVTSSYSPPYANNSAIPLVPSEAERFGLALGSEITVTAPAQSAYLIITTFDGGNHSVDWSVEITPTNIYGKLQEIDGINERADELSLTVDGVSEEGTGTWGELTLRENIRVFTYCNQKSYKGGVIKVKMSDYSTYQMGLLIQDGTSYSSTVIYDTGWKSSDIEHRVRYNEAGYNIRVTFRRVNNSSLTVQDIQNVLTLLSYEYNYYEGGLVGKVDGLENAEVYKPQRIPMKVIGEMYYVGNKIDLQEHPYTASLIGTFSSTGSYVQGAAVFGKYLFQFHNTNDSVNVFNLETQQEVQTISLTANPNCHANTASFGGQFYDVNDEFPCVYVSSEGEKKVYVYRITGTEGSFVLTLVQTLSYDISYYYPNLNVDAPNNRGVLVGYKANSYILADGNMMMCCCFDLPSVTEGDKTLATPYNEFSFPFIYATQGVFSKYGKMYLSFGNTYEGLQIGGIVVVDYLLKNVVSFIDLKAVGNFEPEGLGMYDGGFIVTTQSRTIYKIDFPET